MMVENYYIEEGSELFEIFSICFQRVVDFLAAKMPKQLKVSATFIEQSTRGIKSEIKKLPLVNWKNFEAFLIISVRG